MLEEKRLLLGYGGGVGGDDDPQLSRSGEFVGYWIG
jgi:hypothetical protein